MSAKLDLTGQKFGRLTVLAEDTEPNIRPGSFWLVLCDCGQSRSVWGSALRNGNTKSCGCLARDRASAALSADLVGQVFGRLTVLERSGSRDGNAIWACGCLCGGRTVVSTESLKSGNTSSCGCAKRDAGRAKKRDLIGETFGRLTVLAEHPARQNGKVRWLCACSCGAEKVVNGAALVNGMTLSCGCGQGDGARKRFDELRALRDDQSETHSQRRERREREQRDGKCPTRRGVWARDSGGMGTAPCHLCAQVIHRAEPWILEHLVPLWAGGRDSYENVAVVCLPCAKTKTALEAAQRALLAAQALRDARLAAS